jgi:hypothetical protein
VIEYIEERRLELRLDSLRDGEILEDGHVRHQLSWSCELVAPDIAKLSESGISKRTALRGAATGQTQFRLQVRTSLASMPRPFAAPAAR